MKEFSIDRNTEGQRIDRYLSDELEDRSRSYIQKIMKEGYVKVNQKPVKSNYRLSFGDSVEVTLPEAKEPDIVPENIPLDILYEDQDIIMINKPKQMVVHPAPGHYSGTLVNALMYHCGDELSGIRQLRQGTQDSFCQISACLGAGDFDGFPTAYDGNL